MASRVPRWSTFAIRRTELTRRSSSSVRCPLVIDLSSRLLSRQRSPLLSRRLTWTPTDGRPFCLFPSPWPSCSARQHAPRLLLLLARRHIPKKYAGCDAPTADPVEPSSRLAGFLACWWLAVSPVRLALMRRHLRSSALLSASSAVAAADSVGKKRILAPVYRRPCRRWQ
jgi:hypothetical protein